jgi:hypothetical protein
MIVGRAALELTWSAAEETLSRPQKGARRTACPREAALDHAHQ